ncbi:molybdate ABC transporter substrate-binding protein [Hydrogenophaga sp. PAMC20947]|uniref:molybdate ABC transporter substrate-binding protein n=1 Tax=Hydrogenophaga sp. PAMC20947 TaxID=2565558 RepID=UPI00109D984E|nr:molybdate ABC transporter substrate-binding protein [Hydrogenophaga sp. PAMC20947]QCB44856.1 molybdate ABC transporter substrate-binding protein [Hydrogenophaga sp. PAMC20947]
MSLTRHCLYFLSGVLASAVSSHATAAQAQIAVAANFAQPIKAVAELLNKTTGHTVQITLGSTGKLYAQIKNGAPFDAFLAANTEAPERLENEGLALPGSRFTYATGKLVLWSSRPDRVDPSGAVLKRPDLGKVAYANPKTAPYGAAALQVMDALGLSATLAPSLVMGESIGQAYTFVYSGNADVGFVALSQVLEGGRLKGGSMWQPPQNLYAPIKQDAVLLQRGSDNPAAVALMKLLKSPEVQTLIGAYGYEP